MAEKILRSLYARLTQGAADDFVQASIETLLEPSNGVAFRVVVVEFLNTSAVAPAALANSEVSWSITTDTKAAVAKYDDTDTIMADGYRAQLLTSGAVLIPNRFVYKDPTNFLIVEPFVFLQLDSTATGVVNSFDVRLYYEEQKMSEVEILRLLANA